MIIDRRSLAMGAVALSLAPRPALAQQTVTDSAGRTVTLPAKITKIFAAGGPAAVAVYVLRPDAMVGWPRKVRPEEQPYVMPAVRDLPEVGMITGRGDTANLEAVLKAKPDVIVDFGSVTPTYASLADGVQARTGIPYLLVDGRFENTGASLRKLGQMLQVGERGETLARYAEALIRRVDETVKAIPEEQRPKVYLARGSDGLETGVAGSINTEVMERAGGRNVADAGGGRRNIANVSPEQVLLWDPDIIVTWDRNFHQKVTVGRDPLWQSVKAVREGRVHLAPTAPFGWIDRPPSMNRLIGLAWLANLFHGARFPVDIAAETRTFYRLFYQVEVSDADLGTLLAWADGKAPGMGRPK